VHTRPFTGSAWGSGWRGLAPRKAPKKRSRGRCSCLVLKKSAWRHGRGAQGAAPASHPSTSVNESELRSPFPLGSSHPEWLCTCSAHSVQAMAAAAPHLRQEHAGAGRPGVSKVVRTLQPAGGQHDAFGAYGPTFQPASRQRLNKLQAREMLRPQPWVVTLGADLVHPYGRAADGAQRGGVAQDLPAAFQHAACGRHGAARSARAASERCGGM
jgi:hypothetical protein